MRAEQAKKSLGAFIRYIDVPGTPVLNADGQETETFYPERLTPAEHHLLLIDALERVERGELRRLMVFMPPGSAKTTYTTVCFPTWFLGRKRRRAIMALSYGGDLAKKFGRKCRQITRSAEYLEIFDTELVADNKATDDWSLTNESEFMAAGMNMGITGNRVDGAVIDDPIKGRAEADSQLIRDRAWETYKTDVRTRLKPGGFLVWVLTRWHEDDPVGRILPENYAGESGWIDGRDGERWFVICIPAECEREDDPLGREIGAPLWPEWFRGGHFAKEKIIQGPRNWSALYQQRPAPEEGSYFKRDWWHWYDAQPPLQTLRIIGASDYAVTDGGGDFTVHGVAGVDADDNIYILDWWRAQEESDVWIEVLIDLIEQWTPAEWGEERGQIEKSLGPFISRRMRERQTYCHREQFTSSVNKPTRAQAFRGLMSMGKVFWPRDAPWVEAVQRAVLSFGGGGKIDDDVDVLSLFGRMVGPVQVFDQAVAQGALSDRVKPLFGGA